MDRAAKRRERAPKRTPLLMPTPEILEARRKWRYQGDERPPFAVVPTPGSESVWDYPRPPSIVADGRHIRVQHGGRVLAESSNARRVLETASPPTFYLPPSDVAIDELTRSDRQTFCEWKGRAQEYDVADASGAAWCYHETFPEFAVVNGFFAFYPGKVHCTVDGETVRAQPGGFYGGWITSELVGPFKGEADSEPWW